MPGEGAEFIVELPRIAQLQSAPKQADEVS